MDGYSVKVRETYKELSAKERIKIKDTSNAIKLDEATKDGKVIITPANYVILEIHNEKSDNKDYLNYVIEDVDGTKYCTGSASFWSSFIDIVEEMDDAGETDYQIECYRLPSKNYKGKDFLTCSIL